MSKSALKKNSKKCSQKQRFDQVSQPSKDAENDAVGSLEALTALSNFDTAYFAPLKGTDDASQIELLYSTNGCQRVCPRCAHASKDEHWSEQCRKSHIAAGMLADRYGGKYVYVCPEKKLFTAAPVISGRSVNKVMIAGPVEIAEEDEAPTTYDGYEPFRQCSIEDFHRVTLLLSAIAAASGENEETYLRRVGQNGPDEHMRMSDSLIRNSENSVMREYPIGSENDMVDAIKSSNPVGALAAYDRIYGSFNSYGMARGDHHAYERLVDLVVIISRAGLESGIDTGIIFEASERCRDDLKYTATSLQVYHRIRFFIEEVIGYVQSLSGVGYERNIYRIQTYVFTHYAEPITLEMIADDIGYSPAYLSRVFKEKTGTNLFTFINKVRIEAAMSDLRTTDYSVAEIAKRNGFESTGYFTRVFKKVTDNTPSHYRNLGGQSRTA